MLYGGVLTDFEADWNCVLFNFSWILTPRTQPRVCLTLGAGNLASQLRPVCPLAYALQFSNPGFKNTHQINTE